MRISRFIVASLVAPVMMSAQVAPPATAGAKLALDRMQANVARIAAPAERERWNANVEMWKVVFAKAGTLSTADVDALKASLKTIRTNVASIARPAEKERWSANVRLWQMFVREMPAMPTGMPMTPPGGVGAMPCCSPGAGAPHAMATDAAFGRMTLNVAKIAEPAEKERWQANCDLWQLILFQP